MPQESTIRQLIQNGKVKTALDGAKELHKQQGSASTEALLIDAYAARIQSLEDQNLPLEAKSLRDLVYERFPLAKQRIGARSGGTLDELLAPLNEPQLSAENRAAIEHRVQTTVTDLAALAACPALPPEHDLRVAAAAIEAAFKVVTSAEVTEEQIALPEVSRRSPLASWKSLIRAIACFYRREDDACRQWLAAIQPESVAARLVPAMQTMLGAMPDSGLKPAAATLVSRISTNSAALRNQLEKLNHAFERDGDEDEHQNHILKLIRSAMQECGRSAPGRMEALKRLIFVRGAVHDLDSQRIATAIGGAPERDANLFRMLARGMELHGDPEGLSIACRFWDRFRDAAQAEGWFPPKGPEMATLYLHMAGVLARIPEDILLEIQLDQDLSRREDVYFLFREDLYARACAIDPHPEGFSPWLHWASSQKGRQGENVAKAWHKIRPTDMEPLLFLMHDAEKRKAFTSALAYLDKAEAIDAVHSEVRAARMRLLASNAMRHLEQKKPHLAAEKLAALAALPQLQQGDRPAFLAALGYLIALRRGDAKGMAESYAEASRLLGSYLAAGMMASVVAGAIRPSPYVDLPPVRRFTKADKAMLPAAMARVLALARDMGIEDSRLPFDYLIEAGKQFLRVSDSLETSHVRRLAEAALSGGLLGFGYAASGVGLRREDSTAGRFLLLRAQSLRRLASDRPSVCAAAAVELARRHHDSETVARAVDFVRFHMGPKPFALTADQAGEVLLEERAATAFPAGKRLGPNYSRLLPEKLCDCPKCRAQRGESVNPFEDRELDEKEMDKIFNSQVPKGIPPELARMMLEVMKKAFLSGDDPEEAVGRMVDQLKQSGKPKKGRRE